MVALECGALALRFEFMSIYRGMILNLDFPAMFMYSLFGLKTESKIPQFGSEYEIRGRS
jgi:hypothetical protein